MRFAQGGVLLARGRLRTVKKLPELEQELSARKALSVISKFNLPHRVSRVLEARLPTQSAFL